MRVGGSPKGQGTIAITTISNVTFHGAPWKSKVPILFVCAWGCSQGDTNINLMEERSIISKSDISQTNMRPWEQQRKLPKGLRSGINTPKSMIPRYEGHSNIVEPLILNPKSGSRLHRQMERGLLCNRWRILRSRARALPHCCAERVCQVILCRERGQVPSRLLRNLIFLRHTGKAS